MGEGTKIEWATHTFNPWVGCAKVSQACTNCYAEGWAKRTGHAGLWRGERRRTGVGNWRQPLKWNRETPGARVFCASLADVFELGEDEEMEITLAGWRDDLFDLISRTPNLTWLLLTKRPHIAARYFRSPDMMLPNVWIGTTVENQAAADERIPHLLNVPARVRFLSMEPLLGPVDLTQIGILRHGRGVAATYDALRGGMTPQTGGGSRVSWVIAGGESGPGARPMHPQWARSLRDQCASANVPFFFKQWGEWAHDPLDIGHPHMTMHEDPRHNERNVVTWACSCKMAPMVRVGKARAGRVLDGQTWDEVPRG